MSEAEIKTTTEEETDNDPIYYKPSWLSLVATIASWFSWLVFAVFIIEHHRSRNVDPVTDQRSGVGAFSKCWPIQISIPTFSRNLLLPFFTGIVYFLVLQGVSIGLNVVLEMDFNIREKMEVKVDFLP